MGSRDVARVPLKELFKASGVRRKRVVARPVVPSRMQERELAAAYVEVVRVWVDGVNDDILPAYSATRDTMIRDSVSDINIEIEKVAERAVQAILTFSGKARSWAETFSRWHLRRFIANLVYKDTAQLETLMTVVGGGATETIDDIVTRNVALVRNVSDQIRAKISDAVFRGIQTQTPVRDVAKEIAKATGLQKDRSLRIASDQTVKLSAALDKQRQLDVGMDSFEWVHSDKVHFRPEHKARDGKVFRWDSDVGRNDPPGFLPFCGCKSRGVLDLGDDEDE